MGAQESALFCETDRLFCQRGAYDDEDIRRHTKGTKSYAHYLKTHHETLAVYPTNSAHWTSAANHKKEIVVSSGGLSSSFAHTPMTISALFQKVAKNRGSRTALAVERPVPAHAASLPEEKWTKWSYHEYFSDTSSAAKGLMDLGVTQFSSVCIYAWNAPEWSIAQLATTFIGAKAVGIYPNDSPETAAKKLHHSDARTLIVDSGARVECFRDLVHLMPELRTIVYWGDNITVREFSRAVGKDVKVISWTQFISDGMHVPNTQLQERMDAVEPGHAAALIYAEGDHNWTEKPPVMLSHDNLLFSVASFLDAYAGLSGYQDERVLSFLPPAHISSLMTDVFAPLLCTLQKEQHTCTVYFARKRDLQDGPLIDRARTVKPTIFFAFVDIWDALADKIMERMCKESELNSHIISWAVNERLRSKGKMMNENGDWQRSAMYNLANFWVLKASRNYLGLSDVRFAWTTTGSIKNSTMDFFGALGLHINELYGTAESSGPVTTSTAETACLWNGAGMQFPGCEVKLLRDNGVVKTECPQVAELAKPGISELGEVYIRGRHVMMGHYANPAFGAGHMTAVERLNRATIMDDGFMRTGHLGIHHGGLIYVTSNIKGQNMLFTSTRCLSTLGEGIQSDSGVAASEHSRSTIFSPPVQGDGATTAFSPRSGKSETHAARRQNVENLLHTPTSVPRLVEQPSNHTQAQRSDFRPSTGSGSERSPGLQQDIMSMENITTPKSEPPQSLHAPTVFGSSEFREWMNKIMSKGAEPADNGTDEQRRGTSIDIVQQNLAGKDQQVVADEQSPARALTDGLSKRSIASGQHTVSTLQRSVAFPAMARNAQVAAKTANNINTDNENSVAYGAPTFVLEN
eukprot:GEMP01009915.1.p1 GENE.GEMP01009915.1~~GEMP01009915.1.p1  ORF type:complete len:861 (+),score=164.62 GEMP01009915.1:92-2674(+)